MVMAIRFELNTDEFNPYHIANLLFFRAVEDKNIGPLVKTIMTRCIHCTRCIRYDTVSG